MVAISEHMAFVEAHCCQLRKKRVKYGRVNAILANTNTTTC